jgi:hypothetical protein
MTHRGSNTCAPTARMINTGAGLAALTLGAVSLHAESGGTATTWMSEPEMTLAFTGKTISGNYASGKPFTETYLADGAISYREQAVEYQGHWSLQGGTFCTIYASDPTGGCYRVRQVSANCYEFYFVTRTEAEAALGAAGRPAWTARAAVSDRDATCQDKPSV